MGVAFPKERELLPFGIPFVAGESFTILISMKLIGGTISQKGVHPAGGATNSRGSKNGINQN